MMGFLNLEWMEMDRIPCRKDQPTASNPLNLNSPNLAGRNDVANLISTHVDFVVEWGS